MYAPESLYQQTEEHTDHRCYRAQANGCPSKRDAAKYLATVVRTGLTKSSHRHPLDIRWRGI